MEQLHVIHLQCSLLTVPKELCVVEEMSMHRVRRLRTVTKLHISICKTIWRRFSA